MLDREDLVTRTCEYQIPSLVATLRSDVDDGIRVGDDVEIVLDDEYRVPLLYETIEDIEELLHIREVESCRWLIEDIECLTCRSLGEVERELDTLRLSTRERRCGLSESDIPETDIDEDIEHSLDPWEADEEGTRILDRHIEYFGDIFSLELYLKGLVVVSGPTTRFTLDINIREEMHLDLLGSAPLTDLTTTSLGIETKSPRTKSSLLSVERCGEYLTNMGEESGIGGDIGVWSFANRGLIDDDRLVDMIDSLDAVMATDLASTRIKMVHQVVREDVDDER